jgi:hypothetical protein
LKQAEKRNDSYGDFSRASKPRFYLYGIKDIKIELVSIFNIGHDMTKDIKAVVCFFLRFSTGYFTMLLVKMRTEKKDVVNMDTRRRFVPTSNTIMKMVEISNSLVVPMSRRR